MLLYVCIWKVFIWQSGGLDEFNMMIIHIVVNVNSIEISVIRIINELAQRKLFTYIFLKSSKRAFYISLSGSICL